MLQPDEHLLVGLFFSCNQVPASSRIDISPHWGWFSTVWRTFYDLFYTFGIERLIVANEIVCFSVFSTQNHRTRRIFGAFCRSEFATYGDKPTQVENFSEIVRHTIEIQMQCVERPDSKPFIKCTSADFQANPFRFAQTEKCLHSFLCRHG